MEPFSPSGMAGQRGGSPDAPTLVALVRMPNMQMAVTLLLEAQHCAQQSQCSPWQFAVARHDLWAAGLTDLQLRRLVWEGVIEHALEQTRPADAKRTFRKTGNPEFYERSCFVLTATGLEQVRRERQALFLAAAPGAAAGIEVEAAPDREQPYWEEENHTLYWRGKVVNHFKRTAPDQESILRTFQSSRWQPWIAANLLPDEDGCLWDCLADTIKNLNRNVRPHLRFFREGRRGRIGWEAAR